MNDRPTHPVDLDAVSPRVLLNARFEAVDLDALFPPRAALTDRDGAMADLGLRVQSLYPGAATTPAQVRAIRESWAKPTLWDRLVAWAATR